MCFLKDMLDAGIDVPEKRVFISIQEADKWFHGAMSQVLNHFNRQYIKTEEYDPIIEWLSDNEGLGIAIMGNPGSGKTIITRFVIPYILHKARNLNVKYFNAIDIKKSADIKAIYSDNKIIAIDDIGVEEVVSEYGSKIDAFPEIMDRVEKDNKLLIINTNLDQESFKKRYGVRAYDRLKSCLKPVVLTNKSFR